MEPRQLAIIIIAGNEEETIIDCLRSASFADQLILVAANSSDKTVYLAKKLNPKVEIINTSDDYGRHFAKWRNLGLNAATTNWVLYLDADERITDHLRQEILDIIKQPKFSYFVIPRYNYYLGKRVRYGGSYPDYVKRLYRRDQLFGWTGVLHEEPNIKGEFGYLKSPLNHFTHRNLNSMLQKTIIWTQMEAEALYKNNHPPIVWWRLIRMMLTTFLNRLVRQQMWRDGTIGWISVVFESFNTFIIYSKLWELQQKGKNHNES